MEPDDGARRLGSRTFAAGHIWTYLTLSRVISHNGIHIEELDYSKLTVLTPCNTDALAEMESIVIYIKNM